MRFVCAMLEKSKKAKTKYEEASKKYQELYLSCTKEDKHILTDFFCSFSDRVKLEKKQLAMMQLDFKNAFVWYSNNGIDIKTAADLIALSSLGTFYETTDNGWWSLDDAAKIYPLSSTGNRMTVFRLSVYLKQKIVPEILQLALHFTIKRFPTFATDLKNGMFWHYLETAKRRYKVSKEADIPCRPMRVFSNGTQLFNVLYYNNRISVEFFHVLTDGTGGMLFLKTFTAEYLRLLGVKISTCDGVLNVNEKPSEEESANDFSKVERSKKASGFFGKPALQLGGRLSKVKPCRILHFCVNAKELKQAAKEKNVTVTAYILAMMFVAGKDTLTDCAGDINIQVPVNMRKFYPSKSQRNFALYCGIKLPTKKITTVDEILPIISNQLTGKSSLESMNCMMNSTAKMVNSPHYIPLCIKKPFVRLAYGYLGDMIFSSTLSNLGVVKLPKDMAEHIDYFDFILGPGISNRIDCAMVTFEDTAVLSVTKITSDPSFEERLLALLLEDGLNPSIKGSDNYDG